MCKKGIVFTKEEIPKLSEKDAFLTQTVSQVIENQPRKFMEIQNILVSIGLTSKCLDMYFFPKLASKQSSVDTHVRVQYHVRAREHCFKYDFRCDQKRLFNSPYGM